jgi:hypothetical protein
LAIGTQSGKPQKLHDGGKRFSLFVTNKLKHIPQRAPPEKRRQARLPAPQNGKSSRRAGIRRGGEES